MHDADQLRELHDAYVWEVNAAVGEDRLDLVSKLADDYLDQALRIMSTDEPRGCERPDCVVCARAALPPPLPQPRRWRRLGPRARRR
jgi:hypothetical protein